MASRIVVEWKTKFDNEGKPLIEVYSSLVVFLSIHKEKAAPLGTINNYISRLKISFENENLRITRAEYFSPSVLRESKSKKKK